MEKFTRAHAQKVQQLNNSRKTLDAKDIFVNPADDTQVKQFIDYHSEARGKRHFRRTSRYWYQVCYKKLLAGKPTHINGKFINPPKLDLSNLLSK